MKSFTVDRLEGDFIVLEKADGTTFSVPKALYPEAKEGDVLNVSADPQKKEEKLKSSIDKMNSIFKK